MSAARAPDGTWIMETGPREAASFSVESPVAFMGKDLGSVVLDVDWSVLAAARAETILIEAESFSKSPHVLGRQANIEKLPTCITCHGGHDVLAITNPNARTNHRNSVTICIACHEDQELTERVSTALKELQTSLPADIRIDTELALRFIIV